MLDRMRGLKLHGRKICLLGLVVFSISCGTAPRPDDLKIAETKRLWQTVPIYPGVTVTVNNTVTADSPLVITKTYKLDAQFADVRQFYLERLAPAGWQFVGENEVKHKGRIRGERVLTFTHSNHRLIVQFAGELRGDLGWDYAVELAPSDYWQEMVF